MLAAVAAFLPFAALLALSPGPATALVIHSAARGGRSEAVRATVGNAAGLWLWAAASVLGISALVAASETAFTVLRLFGGVVLVVYGAKAIHAAWSGRLEAAAVVDAPSRSPMRMGLVTALANPKVGLFYIALLPQFIPADEPLLALTLILAAVQITLSCAWYLVLASAVDRLRAVFIARRAHIQTVTGAAMVGFGVKILAD